MWKQEYIDDLNKIVELLNKKNFDEAYNLLDTYLFNIKDIGSYDKNVWKVEWRDNVYKFATLFKDDATKVLNSIKVTKEKNGCSEAVDFIYSEIIWNFFDNKNEYVKNEIKSLIIKYKTNPEFHHTYSHILEENKSYNLALDEAKHALSQEKNNHIFMYGYTGKLKSCVDNLINKGRIGDCEKFLSEEEKYYKEIREFQKDTIVLVVNDNKVTFLKDRIKDHKIIASQINHFTLEIERKIQIEQRKLVELLGLFSGIIAFILTNINIGISNLNLKEMLSLMFAMASVLMIFSISISYLFSSRDRDKRFFIFIKKPKFWSIIILGIILLILFISVK